MAIIVRPMQSTALYLKLCDERSRAPRNLKLQPAEIDWRASGLRGLCQFNATLRMAHNGQNLEGNARQERVRYQDTSWDNARMACFLRNCSPRSVPCPGVSV